MKLNVTLDEKATKLFEAVKEHLGVKSNTSVIGNLLSLEYKRIQEHNKTRILIPDKDYQILEVEAQKQGLTVDEYVDKIVMERLEEARNS